MKRITALILLFVITISLTACDGNPKTKPANTQATSSEAYKQFKPRKLSSFNIVDEKHFLAGDDITYEQVKLINNAIQSWMRTSSMQYITIDSFDYDAPVSALKKAGKFYYNIYHYNKGGSLLKHIVLIYRKLSKKEVESALRSDLSLIGAFVFTDAADKKTYLKKTYKENQKNTEIIFGKAGKEIADFGAPYSMNDNVSKYTLHFTDEGLLWIGYKNNGKQAYSKILKGDFDKVYKSVKYNNMLDSRR